ncbi:MAG: DUF2842 domain-containing protein [Paracoccaceae bacterium]
MTLSYRARKFVAILVLIVGIPVYVVVSITVLNALGRPDSLLVELIVYVTLGIAWAIPLRRLFLGIGQPDPESAGPRFKDDHLR